MASNKPKVSIPEWQKRTNTTMSSSSEPKAGETLSDSYSSPSTPSRSSETEDLKALARDFLTDPDIKNAPREEKLQFLIEKGLNISLIEELLAEISSETPSSQQSTTLKTVHDSTSANSASQSQNQQSSSSSQTFKPTPHSQSTQNLPPIITYPEFLLRPPKPPPLVTTSGLLTGVYTLSALAALTYTVSTYLVEPMLETLTSARHDLHSHTSTSLSTLNDKLEGIVSHVPYIPSSIVRAHQSRSTNQTSKHSRHSDNDEEPGAENDSVTSDPTELFHRDIGVQTDQSDSESPDRTHKGTITQSTHLDPTIHQASRISQLRNMLGGIVDSANQASMSTDTLSETIKEFQAGLDKLERRADLLKTTESNSTGSGSEGVGKKGTEAAAFKQEIRALKGVFLGSRNFASVPRAHATQTVR